MVPPLELTGPTTATLSDVPRSLARSAAAVNVSDGAAVPRVSGTAAGHVSASGAGGTLHCGAIGGDTICARTVAIGMHSTVSKLAASTTAIRRTDDLSRHWFEYMLRSSN